MKHIKITILLPILTAFILFCLAPMCGQSWGATLEGVTITGCIVNPYIPTPTFKFTITTLEEDDSFTLPIYNGGSYTFNVDWGDGSDSDITSWDDGDNPHTYADAGASTYTIKITGTIEGWKFNNTGDKLLIQDIKSWGPLRLGNLQNYFLGCANLTISATDPLDFTGTTDLYACFGGCTSLTSLAASSWDVSLITSLNRMFYQDASLTSVSVGNWDTSSNISFFATFGNCTSLIDPDIDNWDITSGEDFGLFISSWGLSTAKYDATLIAWEAQAVQDNVTANFGTSTYTGGGTAETARQALIDDHSWIITDGDIAP